MVVTRYEDQVGEAEGLAIAIVVDELIMFHYQFNRKLEEQLVGGSSGVGSSTRRKGGASWEGDTNVLDQFSSQYGILA